MLLHIDVKNKVANYRKRDGCIVCGNSDYQIKFSFDSEWNAATNKTARFIWGGQYTDVTFTGDTCNVPIITNADSVEIGVYAGNLRTTTSAQISCLRSILCVVATPNVENGNTDTRSTDKLKTFIDNTDIDYAYDSDTHAHYTVIRVYKNKIDGSKQYPFVYAPNGAGPRTQSTYDLSHAEGWLLAINAGVFYLGSGNAEKEGKPDGIVVQDGKVIQNSVADTHIGAKPLTIDSNGNLGYAEADADANDLIANGIISAVTGFAPLIIDYAPVSRDDYPNKDNWDTQAQRQIIGQFRDGDYAIITCEGRRYLNPYETDDYFYGWTLAEAQTICQKHGLKFAYNLDGGGSTETMVGLKQLNTIYDGTTGRLVPTFIVFNGTTVFGKPSDLIVPDEDEPTNVPNTPPASGGDTPPASGDDTSNLPSGYTKLSYLIVPKGAYINTGIPASADYDAEGKHQAGNPHVLSAEYYFYPTFTQVGATRYCRYTRYGNETLTPFEFDYNKSYSWRVTGETVEVEGTTLTTTATKGTNTPTGNLYLFCYGDAPTNQNYHFSDGYFYYLRLFDKASGKLLYEYLPCKNPSGVYGLYETEHGVFYKSQGTTEFRGA